jgi:threonine dehydratase
MKIENDLTPIRSALYETGELVNRLVATSETVEIIRERLFGSPDVLNEFVSCRTEITPAVGDVAKRMRIIFEPSGALIRLMAALRAGEYKFLIQNHNALTPAFATANSARASASAASNSSCASAGSVLPRDCS